MLEITRKLNKIHETTVFRHRTSGCASQITEMRKQEMSFVIASLLPGEGFQATAQGGGDPAEPDSLPELRRKC